MAEKSSFFNSISGDRKYKAEDWANYFGSLVGNGYRASSLTALQVIPGGDGLSVIVRAGKGFINGYFYDNTEDMTINLPTADGVLARIDRVVLRLSYVERMMYVAIKSSAPSSSPVAPEMQRDADAWELTLADVFVSAGATGVSATNITDRRNDKTYCGPVVALIDQIDTEEFGQQIVDTLEGVQSEAAEILAEIEAELAAVKDTSAFLMRSGGTMTGELKLTVPLALDSGGLGGSTAADGRKTLDVYSTGEVDKKIADIPVDDAVAESGKNAVSGAAVYKYAMSKDTLVLTTTDPGEGVTSRYPDGTVILVYE